MRVPVALPPTVFDTGDSVFKTVLIECVGIIDVGGPTSFSSHTLLSEKPGWVAKTEGMSPDFLFYSQNS